MHKPQVLKYKTERLPLNFIILGYLLAATGVWRIIAGDWMGILYLIIAIFLIFYKSGIIIDVEKKMLKQYTGIFFYKRGKWQDIKSIVNLRLIKTKETRTMSVLSLSRIDVSETFKLYLTMPAQNLELMKGRKKEIIKMGQEISSALQIPLQSNDD